MLNNSLERTFMGPSSLEMRWRIFITTSVPAHPTERDFNVQSQ